VNEIRKVTMDCTCNSNRRIRKAYRIWCGILLLSVHLVGRKEDRGIIFKDVKVKLSLYHFLNEHHAMEAYWGRRCIAPRILDLGARWRWVVSFKPRSLYSQGKNPWYPLDTRFGGLLSRSGQGEEKCLQPLRGLKPPVHSSRSLALYHEKS
jgi:hypothetical protein